VEIANDQFPSNNGGIHDLSFRSLLLMCIDAVGNLKIWKPRFSMKQPFCLLNESFRNCAELSRSYAKSFRSYAEPLRSYTKSFRSYAEPLRSYTKSFRSYAESLRSYAKSFRSYAESLRSYAVPFSSHTLIHRMTKARRIYFALEVWCVGRCCNTIAWPLNLDRQDAYLTRA
jgi:hypothetical protein